MSTVWVQVGKGHKREVKPVDLAAPFMAGEHLVMVFPERGYSEHRVRAGDNWHGRTGEELAKKGIRAFRLAACGCCP